MSQFSEPVSQNGQFVEMRSRIKKVAMEALSAAAKASKAERGNIKQTSIKGKAKKNSDK
jgi:hypothetical protein